MIDILVAKGGAEWTSGPICPTRLWSTLPHRHYFTIIENYLKTVNAYQKQLITIDNQ